ncbi:DUF4352 domain-containing protein [Streptomyces canus]|uniref:DUF4352 domain-containing protein n=1 Tax=Streptomyces canus TaxID=58343 RepID=UPI0033B8BA91
MRTRTTTLAICLLLAGASVGCSGDSEPKQAVAKATTTKTASPAPSPSPSPSQETFKLGDTADITLGGRKLTATVAAFRDRGISAGPGLDTEGRKWALAEVKVCNRGAEAFPVTPFAWTLAYADGVRVEPTHVSDGLPEPLYPLETQLKGGDCVRGNITYEVSLKGRAERVVYSPQDLDEPVEWAVPKA